MAITVGAVYEAVNEYQFNVRETTETQRHKGGRIQNHLFAAFLCGLCVFVSLWFLFSFNSFTPSLTVHSHLPPLISFRYTAPREHDRS